VLLAGGSSRAMLASARLSCLSGSQSAPADILLASEVKSDKGRFTPLLYNYQHGNFTRCSSH